MADILCVQSRFSHETVHILRRISCALGQKFPVASILGGRPLKAYELRFPDARGATLLAYRDKFSDEAEVMKILT
jgi:hypothetical protein